MWWTSPVIASATLVAWVMTSDNYFAHVATSWVIFGITALSLDLVWGRGGVLSLGQTALFGLGGYSGGVVAINFADTTGNTLIWALPTGVIAGAVAAGIVGWLMFYARMGPLQQTILTYTCTLLLWTLMVSFTATYGDAVVGGQNGLSGIPGYVLGFGDSAGKVDSRTMFLISVAIAAILLFGVQRLMRTPFGTIIDCIRLDSLKTALLGYDTRRFELALFVVAGAMAGLAGSMFTLWANFINPSVFRVQDALLIPIYVLVGGIGTLLGGFVGAVAVGWLTFWLGSGAGGDQSTIWLGVSLILLVRFNRAGIYGFGYNAWQWLKRRVTTDTSSTATAVVQVDFDLLHRLRSGNRDTREILLSTREASVSFGGVKPVDAITKTFVPGRVRCVIGPNGAGKSSYLKVCAGTYKADAGEVTVNGVEVTRASPHRRVAAGLGIKNQRAQVFAELDVRTNLWVAAYARHRNSARARETAEAMIEMLGMADRASRPAGDLSHGEQQWLDIGMVLCLAPDVILLDEPAAGMTTEERLQLAQLVRTLSQSAAVVVVDHDMAFIHSLDPEITVLHQGAVFAEGDIDDIRGNERVLDIYLGRRENVLD